MRLSKARILIRGLSRRCEVSRGTYRWACFFRGLCKSIPSNIPGVYGYVYRNAIVSNREQSGEMESSCQVQLLQSRYAKGVFPDGATGGVCLNDSRPFYSSTRTVTDELPADSHGGQIVDGYIQRHEDHSWSRTRWIYPWHPSSDGFQGYI